MCPAARRPVMLRLVSLLLLCSVRASMQAQAVELACRCDDVSDDAVELRLLKALLTAVTSTTLAVHGQALLLVVRACYNIFLTSRSDVNQATAKATLTQVGCNASQTRGQGVSWPALDV